jgi:hypothetical protein
VRGGEPYWLADDRLWALAWEHDRQSKLACGCYPDETTGVANDDAFTATPIVCHRHRAIGEAAEWRARNATDADSQHGLLWVTSRDPRGDVDG